ncbi:MAG: ABC transporter permease [Pigmentiphaga sp.]|uniref:ABC transporter permease n=1 Tax=Pigmentiphaga sp. TaxID=1977564 RepID=UPI0029A338BE|nr:ABC transporter permease [Pigmentiphaga sp.]MDX3907098.1 ABC transporter permease [Pigmentiphaga sp.]
MNILKRSLRSAASWYSVPLAFVVWQLVAMSGVVSPRVLPSLDLVLTALVQDVLSGDLLYHAGITIYRVLIGFAIGSAAGVLIGFVLARLRWFEFLFEPVFFAGYPVPKIALFPIFTFIFGIGTPSKIAFAALECLYPVVVATHLATRGTAREIVWAGQNMGLRGWTLLRHVLIPAALPGIMGGLRIALPIGITVVVVTEMIGDTHGLGFYVGYAGTSFRSDKLYAGIVMIGLVGLALDLLQTAVRRRILRWADLQK